MTSRSFACVVVVAAIVSAFTVLLNRSSQWKDVRVQGTVMKIAGSLPNLVSSPATFANDSVRLGDVSLVYTVKQESDNKLVTINVIEDSRLPRAALMTRICVGTKISYTVREHVGSDKWDFASDPYYYMGSNYSSDILVPEPCMTT